MTLDTADGAGRISWPRAIIGVIIGLLIMPIIMVAAVFTLVPLLFREDVLLMGLMTLMAAIALFLGGFVGRLIAGPRPAVGRVGLSIIAVLVVLSVIQRFLPQLQGGWNYVPGQGWVPIDLSSEPIHIHTITTVSYTILLWLVFLAFSIFFACLGDRVAMRRWRATGNLADPDAVKEIGMTNPD